ncbi:putative pentatricopeptide repeat-containing protein At2g01510 [Sesamum indicum]|uniref:Pentatricopeptide repeat-containing protein At2g01510 n=1 Tax=Sesamum indicum TaxID=4182 RepID=A0A8M8ULU6_SESIN|nr:putative pentatricopeptide repeat-containing protein At2g01510 [Sesamum indicum]
MRGKVAVSWTILIGGYAQNKQPMEAFNLYVEMLRTGLKPDHVTFATLLSGCDETITRKDVHQVHAQITRLGFDSDLAVCNSLVDSYCKSQGLELAFQLFKGMITRDTITFNTMITGCSREGLNEQAIELFSEMQHYGFRPSDFTFAALLRACVGLDVTTVGQQVHALAIKANLIKQRNALVDMYAKCGRFDEANIIFENLADRSSVAWTAMISACVQQGLNDEAFKLFNEMRSNSVCGDQATFASTVRASANLALLSLGKQLHSCIIRAGFMSNVFCGSSLLDMYAKCGSLKDSIVIFKNMPERNTISWNAMISAYAQNGDSKATLRSFKEMVESGVHPDHVSFLGVLTACSHSGCVDEARQYFNIMTQTYKLTPQKEHYASLVDVLCRRGRFKEAEAWMAQMPVEPDEIMWSSILNSCRIHKNQEFAKRAADALFNLDMLRDGAAYVTMSNIYAEAGDWEHMAKVKKAMRERGVRKVPAYSWVEVGRKVHVFTANDRTHPLNDEIRKKIDTLGKRMEEEGYKPHLSCALQNVNDEMKAESLKYHSERLAIAFALISMPERTPILVMKNLRACVDCHAAIKVISKVVQREITVRDFSRFHHFKDGACSCGDYW